MKKTMTLKQGHLLLITLFKSVKGIYYKELLCRKSKLQKKITKSDRKNDDDIMIKKYFYFFKISRYVINEFKKL